MENFTKHYDVWFVVDPAERTNCFYVWDKHLAGLAESPGYFIYYDKNPGMQDYMLENKIVKNAREPVSLDYEFGRSSKNTVERGYGSRRDSSPKSHRRTPATRRDTGEYRRVVNMLVSLSAVLFIICFIMGVGLIQNDNRINRVERQMLDLRGNVNYIAGIVSQDDMQSVFADRHTEGESGITANNYDDETGVPVNAVVATQSPLNPEATRRPTIEEILDNLPPAQLAEETTPAVTQRPAQPMPGPTEVPVYLPFDDYDDDIFGYEEVFASGYSGLVEYDSYIVQRGDTLWQISIRFFGTEDMIDAIMEANGLSDQDAIFSGRELKIPRQR